MLLKRTRCPRYLSGVVRACLLLPAAAALTCTSASVQYRNPSLKYARFTRIGHPGCLLKYHGRLKSEFHGVEFINCNDMYYKDMYDLNRAVDAAARKKGVSSYYEKEQIRKKLVYYYPELDRNTRYRLSFQRYRLSAFIDRIDAGGRQVYSGSTRMSSSHDYVYYLIGNTNQVLLKIRVDSASSSDKGDKAFVDEFIRVMKGE